MRTGPVLLLDSASLYYRSFYALPDSMKAPDGRPHQALRGFLSMLNAFHEQFSPSGIVACWDADWRPEWRVELMPSYKAHRVARVMPDGSWQEEEPDELTPQAQALAELLDAAGIARVGLADYEADDVLASLASSIPGPIVVISGDRDLVQLVDDAAKTQVFLAVNGGMPKWPLLDAQGVVARYGVRADQYVDLAIMRGDPSDGIPGVPGIGQKTASALLHEYGSLDGILDAAKGPAKSPLTPRIQGLLLEHADEVRTARTVATAVRDLHVQVDPAVPERARDGVGVARIVEQWGLQRFIPDWFPA
ncbi:MAG: 5'-3' exonuclease [Actinomycetota bacterium]|nr:5'-3' exonuclease [Actinomycetota bacterium]MDP2288701.1 5'-3' exonuclease [Actinomycetota bacterium]